jgi:hypothetical protein
VKNKCVPNRILDLVEIIDKIESGEESLSWPVFFNVDNGGMYVLAGAIAKPQLDDTRSTVVSSMGVSLFYHLMADTDFEDQR